MKKLLALVLMFMFSLLVVLPAASGEATGSLSAGGLITFGHYPQTAAGDDRTPIEWIVLEVRDGKALVISKYGLDVKPYNTEFTEVTWETCTLRAWLNDEFLNKAFSPEEQDAILTTEADNSSAQGYSGWDTDGGNNTQDKVFLLSYAEANRYLGVTYDDSKNLKARVAPTEFAIKAGAYTSSDCQTADGKATGWWWLRSPGRNRSFAASVYSDGSLLDHNVRNGNNVVRPAFWLNIDSGIF